MFCVIVGRGSGGSEGFGLLSSCVPVGRVRLRPGVLTWTSSQSPESASRRADQRPCSCCSALRRAASAFASSSVTRATITDGLRPRTGGRYLRRVEGLVGRGRFDPVLRPEGEELERHVLGHR